MEFPNASKLAKHFQFVEETGSTNTDLVDQAANLPDFSVLVAGFQSGGRGRSGRQWEAPAGSSLFVSVLLKPKDLSPAKMSWLPLLAGLAISKALNELQLEKRASLKWPNDVLIEQNKISGVLSELVSDLSGVVIGAGINIKQKQAELPIENATSLKIELGRAPRHDKVLALYLKHLRDLYDSFVIHRGDAVLSGLRYQVMNNCQTLGLRVKAILPGNKEVIGEAVGIDDSGRLILLPDGAKSVMAVAAGDIVHLRHN
ncbi:biotin--[acetyl-CoA-carboxylase] ligase [Rhodoluna sp.]|uniref:biotin--[acetyl-CoA-carboxylase] ligase n=1 Tax=Rhodoluna sp. TaxID=1969481 RepID=UPI0025F7B860|nr:biotin--[acetyl-CoA-carboxylase] ligase [Rhodoluna sp.]